MSITNQEFKEILLYPITDENWFSKVCLQVAVMFLLCFFFVGIIFLTGYMVRCVQKGMVGDKTLPGWDEWGVYWKLGWKTIGVGLIFALPIIVVEVLSVVVFGIFLGLADSYNINEAWLGVMVLLGGGVYIFLLCYSIVLAFLQPAYLSAIAAGRTVLESASLKRLWPYVKANWVTILVGMAIFYLTGLIACSGFFVFFIGIFLTYGYAVAAGGYTYGVIYRNSPVKF